VSSQKTWAGQTFNLPLNREPKSSNWGVEVSNFLIHIANQAIPKEGGANSLANELNFGTVAGIAALYLKGVTGTISSTGFIRLGNSTEDTDKAENWNAIAWRNAANSADLPLKANASDRLEFNAVAVPTISSIDSLTNKTITAATNNISADRLTSGSVPDARVPASNVTQHVGSIVHQSLSGAGTNTHAQIDTAVSNSASHISNTSNPHSVTQTQVIGDSPITLKELATPANPSATYYKFYPKSDGKLYRLNSAGVEAMVGGGGGLVVEVLDAPATSGVDLVAGKHYIVTGLTADTTLNLPVGASESAWRVSVLGNNTSGFRVTLHAAGSDTIGWDGTTTYSDAKIVYADTWVEGSWRTTYWAIDDASSPLSGTFSGAIEFTGVVTASAGIKLPTSGGTPGTLDFYEEYTLSSNILYVDNAAQAFGIKVIRVGKTVTLTNTVYASGTKVNTTNPTVQQSLPARFRPATEIYAPWVVRNNGTFVTGAIWIKTDGSILFYNAGLAAWTGSGDCSIERGSISYVLT